MKGCEVVRESKGKEWSGSLCVVLFRKRPPVFWELRFEEWPAPPVVGGSKGCGLYVSLQVSLTMPMLSLAPRALKFWPVVPDSEKGLLWLCRCRKVWSW